MPTLPGSRARDRLAWIRQWEMLAVSRGRPCILVLYINMASIGRGLPSHLARHPREASGGVYTMFDAAQVKQFKEAFATIDQDGDGRVSEEDLKTMLSSLGR